jgi:uncharacterized protein GlcG (DUF336 family)
LKVKCEFAPAVTVSVIARQEGTNLSPYAVEKAGSIALLQVGTHPVQEMTAQFVQTNFAQRVLAWVMGGLLLLFGGLLIKHASKQKFS